MLVVCERQAAYAVLATAASLSLISVSTSIVKVYGGQLMSRLLSVVPSEDMQSGGGPRGSAFTSACSG